MKIKKKMKMNFYANRIFWAIILLDRKSVV